MIKPDYESGSIVNLMASISRALGEQDTVYQPLPGLSPQQISRYQNIILIVIDGLGYEFLKRYGKDSFIAQHLKQPLTSVFPSTTATAITAFATGLPAQQHAITGWHTYLQEIEQVMAVLPFRPRGEGRNEFTFEEMQAILDIPTPIMSRINTEKYVISPQYIVDSFYSRNISGKAKRVGYESLQECFANIANTCALNNNKKYIYAYWPEFDSICHKLGVDHKDTLNLFHELDMQFRKLIDSLTKLNYHLVLTADHGLINSGEEKTIVLNDYPDIVNCLSQPLCGEPRVAYCYVKPGMEETFLSLVDKHLKDYCTVHKTQELIDQNYFGLYESNAKLLQRAGDFLLLMKNNYAIQNYVAGENEFILSAVHGGLSEYEMLVPLVVSTSKGK